MKRQADDWLVEKDVSYGDYMQAEQFLRCPECGSSAVEETLKTKLLTTSSYYCEDCDAESEIIQQPKRAMTTLGGPITRN